MKLTTPALLAAALIALAGCAAPATPTSSAPAAAAPAGGGKDVSLAALTGGKADPMASCTDVFGDPTLAATQILGSDIAGMWKGTANISSWTCHLVPAGNEVSPSLIDFLVTTGSDQHAGEVSTAGGAHLYFLTIDKLTAEQGTKVVEWQKMAASHVQK